MRAAVILFVIGSGFDFRTGQVVADVKKPTESAHLTLSEGNR